MSADIIRNRRLQSASIKAKELRLLLHITDQKHFNPEEYGPDLYAADYEELMKLSDEMLIYLA